jgi:hypothetical protein
VKEFPPPHSGGAVGKAIEAGMLRRKIGSFFLIFLIAILAQIWAPSAHLAMMAPTGAESLSTPALSSADCLHDFGAGDEQGAPARHQQCVHLLLHGPCRDGAGANCTSFRPFNA